MIKFPHSGTLSINCFNPNEYSGISRSSSCYIHTQGHCAGFNLTQKSEEEDKDDEEKEEKKTSLTA